MLLNDNKKKDVSLIMAKIGKPELKDAPMKDGAEQDASMPENTAAEELLAAIESKSAAGVVEALKSLMELCAPSEEESSAPEME